MKALGVLLVLAVAARVHVTIWLFRPVSIPLPGFAAAVVAVSVALAVWFAWSAPRRGWPRVIWGRPVIA